MRRVVWERGCAAIPQEVGDLPEMVVIARHRRANSVPVPREVEEDQPV
jgi:hypothetical protein